MQHGRFFKEMKQRQEIEEEMFLSDDDVERVLDFEENSDKAYPTSEARKHQEGLA